MHRRTLMPTCKKKKTESRVRRTRRTRRVRLTQRTRRVRRVRRTRRCKGGNPCEKGIYGYDDNYQCVQAGCDEFECAKAHTGSKPHKDPEQKNKDKELSELMRELAISSGQKDKRRHALRATNPQIISRTAVLNLKSQSQSKCTPQYNK